MFRKTYKTKLFVNILAIFLITIIIVATFQYRREKDYRISLLNNTLGTINDITYQYIRNKHIYETKQYNVLDSLMRIIPEKGIRVTIIRKDGKVLYDSFVDRYDTLENHLYRPEVQQSLKKEFGTNIRKSASTGKMYYYYAKNYDDYFIRTAILYDVNVINFLKTDHLFIYFTLLMFLMTFGALIYTTDRLGETISRLKDFALRAGHDDPIDTSIRFPKNEFGTIGKQIVQIYDNLCKTRDELFAEREKLYRHLQTIEEGVAVFSSSKKKLLVNRHFIQYINLISEKTITEVEDVFGVEAFREVNEFIEKLLHQKRENEERQYQQVIHTSGMYFQVQCVVFQDGSFELLIHDVTRSEKNRLIKQEMIANLSHELKTPVTSIMGYLETLLTQDEIDEKTQKHFVKRAYRQTKRLSKLIADISLLNKMGEAEEIFKIKEVNVRKVIREVIESQQYRLSEKQIQIRNAVEKNTNIYGNRDLIFSIFQNLIENTIQYAGEEVRVEIRKYHEDEQYCYFSYSDTGPGIPEEHQKRIFERFYRIDAGRSRKQGGTGLGLSIVKNAVVFHKGEITVRNRPGGGVEFLFTLAKNKE